MTNTQKFAKQELDILAATVPNASLDIANKWFDDLYGVS